MGAADRWLSRCERKVSGGPPVVVVIACAGVWLFFGAVQGLMS